MNDDASVDFRVVENQLRNVLAFSRACRQHAVGVNKEMWHQFVQQDVNRLNAHLASRTTQIQLTQIVGLQDTKLAATVGNLEDTAQCSVGPTKDGACRSDLEVYAAQVREDEDA